MSRMSFLPTQQKYLDAVNDPAYWAVLMTGPNQCGKSMVAGADLVAEMLGYEPWSGRRRNPSTYPIALLLEDYDNHGRKFLEQNIYWLVPQDEVHVVRTQGGGPRTISIKGGISSIYVYTRDQDPARLEGVTVKRVHLDEPNSRAHTIALIRGLQKTRGKLTMTMTPISEPWIFEEYYNKAGNLGGSRKDIFAVTAFPEENLMSKGGFLDDESVQRFRESLTEEEIEARVHGRWMHLMGRVYKEFDDTIHIVDELPCPLEECRVILSIDPHDRIPFAMTWTAITPWNDLYVFKEWPETPFEFFKTTQATYKDYFVIIQGGPDTNFIVMDPNFGRKRQAVSGLTVSEELSLGIRRGVFTNIIDDLQAGHNLVRNLLSYDKSKEISNLNAPKLHVLRGCRNVITAFRNYVWEEWSGKISDGKSPKNKPRERYKHFMDCVRYTAMFPPIRRLFEIPQFGELEGMQRGWEATPGGFRPRMLNVNYDSLSGGDL